MWHVQFYLLSGNILSVTRDNPFPIKIHATANATVIPAQSNTPVNPVPIFNNLLYFEFYGMHIVTFPYCIRHVNPGKTAINDLLAAIYTALDR